MQCVTFNTWTKGATGKGFTASGTSYDADVCTSSDSVILTYQNYAMLNGKIDMVQLGITSKEILHISSWGFGVVLMGFLLGYVVSLAIGLIRKA